MHFSASDTISTHCAAFKQHQCGNCGYANLSISQQQETQYAELVRFLQLPLDIPIQWIDSPNQINYRYRITLHPNKEGILGYHKVQSHDHIPIDTCTIAHESINTALQSLGTIPFACKGVEFRSNGTQVLANILSEKGKRPTKAQIETWASKGLSGAGLDGNPMWGTQRTTITIAEIEHQFSLGSFFQVNVPCNELLVQTILAWTLEHQPTQVLDLYCGAGNIGAAIAKKGIPVVGIDSAKGSITDAKNTIKRHNLPMEVRVADADKFQAGDAFFHVAIMDPPRKGAKGVIKELRLTNPKAIMYVSCNPNALRSDLFEAKKLGYVPHRVCFFDFFPHTEHVETLVELRKVY